MTPTDNHRTETCRTLLDSSLERNRQELRIASIGGMTALAVIGTGYVGLTTGACFAHLGHDVICADIDEDKVARLKRGDVPIVEDRIELLVEEGLRNGRLQFTTSLDEAVRECEVAFLCVPTPSSTDGSVDLSFIESAVSMIAGALPSGSIVATKSTVPVGSTLIVERVLDRDDVSVVSNPEFLREGSAVVDFLKPDRVVIGADDQQAAIRVAALYLNMSSPIIITDPATAETVKYAANAFLATKLSFVNAIAAVCEAVDADVDDVMLGLGYDRRIGDGFLRPGPGWGGSCFPKDTRALLRISEGAGYPFRFLEGVLEVNQQQLERVVAKVERAAAGSLNGVTVAVWGLTFKANTDDLRESPSLAVVERLLERGAVVRAWDPTVDAPRPPIPESVEICADPYSACAGAAVLAVLTEWDELRWLDINKVAELMPQQAVVDARNILDRSEWMRAGFDHQGIGR